MFKWGVCTLLVSSWAKFYKKIQTNDDVMVEESDQCEKDIQSGLDNIVDFIQEIQSEDRNINSLIKYSVQALNFLIT